MNENELLSSFPALFATGDPSVLVGSGPDDCAHVKSDGNILSFSADAFVENSHFLPDADPELVARKALAASLSDLAASACRARWALVTLCVRKGAGDKWAARFARGMAETAREYRVNIIGGDIVAGPATFVSITVAGEPLVGGPVQRGGGQDGDILAVTGELGGSLAGRHLRPTPRLREMEALMRFAHERGNGEKPTAAMDISDGLALDLTRLCRESGVGALVEADAIPVAEAAREMAATDGRTPLAHALTDGEDFELLVAMPPRLWETFSRYADGTDGEELSRFTRIGTLRKGEKVGLSFEGREEPLLAEGYEHQW